MAAFSAISLTTIYLYQLCKQATYHKIKCASPVIYVCYGIIWIHGLNVPSKWLSNLWYGYTHTMKAAKLSAWYRKLSSFKFKQEGVGVVTVSQLLQKVVNF